MVMAHCSLNFFKSKQMNRKKFIKHLKIGDVLFTKNDLKTCFMEEMLEYIEKRISLSELIDFSEMIKKNYLSHADNDVLEIINKLHEIHNNLHNPEGKQLSEEEILVKVDEILDSLTSR